MHQAEEDLLVLAAQDGNRKALNMLCRRYQKPLLRYAFNLSKDSDIAHDAVQEVWIRLAKNIRRLKDPRALRFWLYQLVRWRSLDIMRKQNKTNNAEEQFDEQHHQAVDNKNTGVGEDLKAAINCLPKIEKQMIQLFYIDELRISEIAKVLDIPSGTVKSRLNRARNLLKEKFED